MDKFTKGAVAVTDALRAVKTKEWQELPADGELRVLQDWEFSLVGGGEDVPSWG